MKDPGSSLGIDYGVASYAQRIGGFFEDPQHRFFAFLRAKQPGAKKAECEHRSNYQEGIEHDLQFIDLLF